jgi:hypothetical protein
MAIGPFKKAKSAHALLTSLKTLKMSRTEDGYDDYVNKFQDILNSLDPDDQPNNISKCCDFVNGLDKKLEFQVRLAAPGDGTWKDLDALLEIGKTRWTALWIDLGRKDEGGTGGSTHKDRDKKPREDEKEEAGEL